MRFQEKVVIVSGGSGGIGQAVAQRLASEGARIVLVGRHADKLEKAADLVREAGAPEVLSSVCDVIVEKQVMATVDDTLSHFGRLDTVINNAGLMNFKPLKELTSDDWQQAIGVDLFGAFYFIKQAFLHMKPGSSIVNVSSIHAIETEALVAPYAASKAALNSLTRSAAIEGLALGIRINSVLPGAVNTPMLWNNPNVKSGTESVDKEMLGQPADIAATIAYLASADAAFVNGAEVRVDGGRLTRL